MPNLLEIENIASNTPKRMVTLSGISVTILFSTLDAANRLYDWWAGDDPLDQAQIDDLQAWLAAARRELMLSMIGEILVTASATIPDGCLLCDGGTYDRVDYPDLYAALAAAFIIDDDQFRTPDLREKFVYGTSSALFIGNTGGEAAHTLTIGEIPAHDHSIPATITTAAVEPGEVAVLSPVPIISSSTGSTGGSGGHNNIPPYVELLYVIVAV